MLVVSISIPKNVKMEEGPSHFSWASGVPSKSHVIVIISLFIAHSFEFADPMVI